MEIQILKKQGFSLRRIAREVGCAVNTIRRQLAQDAAPKYERKVKRETKLAPFEPYLRERVAAAKPLLWWSNLKRHNDRFFNLNGDSSEYPKIPKNL